MSDCWRFTSLHFSCWPSFQLRTRWRWFIATKKRWDSWSTSTIVQPSRLTLTPPNLSTLRSRTTSNCSLTTLRKWAVWWIGGAGSPIVLRLTLSSFQPSDGVQYFCSSIFCFSFLMKWNCCAMRLPTVSSGLNYVNYEYLWILVLHLPHIMPVVHFCFTVYLV